MFSLRLEQEIYFLYRELREFETRTNNKAVDYSFCFDQDLVIRRWGKEKDKEAFNYFKKGLELAGSTLEEFFNKVPKEDDTNWELLSKVAAKYKWTKTIYDLFIRFKKLYTNKRFSVRDIKLLKKQLKASKKADNVDYNKILYHFPGKSISDIMHQIEDIKK